jgi:hypothetical protein
MLGFEVANGTTLQMMLGEIATCPVSSLVLLVVMLGTQLQTAAFPLASNNFNGHDMIAITWLEMPDTSA